MKKSLQVLEPLGCEIQEVELGWTSEVFDGAYPAKGVLRKLDPDPPLRGGRVFVVDRSTSDQGRTQALIGAIERAAREMAYFDISIITGSFAAL